MGLNPERTPVKFFFEEWSPYEQSVSTSNLLLSMRTTFDIAYQFHNERPLRIQNFRAGSWLIVLKQNCIEI